MTPEAMVPVGDNPIVMLLAVPGAWPAQINGDLDEMYHVAGHDASDDPISQPIPLAASAPPSAAMNQIKPFWSGVFGDAHLKSLQILLLHHC